jgi:hypothetical protein
MAAVIKPPFLSAYDPIADGEGSIDPLGLAATYERLADLILPGITVRMGRPRFLTALAVGAHVCAEFGKDELAADEVTPPYLVFEWWIVEAFIRAADHLAESGRIPGMMKAQACVRNGRPLSAPAYLKTPTVFGFTGIFRRLARHTQILTPDGLLDESGHRLVEVWAKEQGLDGFVYGREGNGARFRDDLRKAVTQGLKEAHTSQRPGAFWQAIAKYLDPAKPGRNERKLLLDLISNRSGPADDVKFIIDALRKRKAPLDWPDEAGMYKSLLKTAPASLKPALTAIDTYESFCRPLNDAFDWMLYLASSEPSAGISAEDYLRRAPASKLHKQISTAMARVESDDLVGAKWTERSEVLTLLREITAPDRIFPTLLEHHRQAQARKPPDGKRPWLEQTARGRLVVRSSYRREVEPAPVSEYLHEYRLPTLSRFLQDLGAFE